MTLPAFAASGWVGLGCVGLGDENKTLMQWRSQKFSTGGASICSIPFCPFPFSWPTKSAVQSKNVMTYHTAWMIGHRPVTLRNQIPKNMYFPDRAWRSLINYSGRASELGGTVNLIDRRRSSLSRSWDLTPLRHCINVNVSVSVNNRFI